MLTKDFFTIKPHEHPGLFKESEMVWDVLKNIKEYVRNQVAPNVSALRSQGEFVPQTSVLYRGTVITEGFKIENIAASKGDLIITQNGERLNGASLIRQGVILEDEDIQIGEGVLIESGALIKGAAIIGNDTEVRQGAYLRGSCLVMRNCVVGHATEMKDSVLLSGAKAGHFAYVGNSILGHDVNLGAGTKLANLKMVERGISVMYLGKRYETGLKKFGAIMNDNVETGCNSVTNPGTVLDKGCIVYPNTYVKAGYYPPKTRILISPRSMVIKN